MSEDPYAALMAQDRKRSATPMVIAISVALLLAGGVILASQLGWFADDSRESRAAPSGRPRDRDKAVATCERAADRYVQCVGEVLGPEAKAIAASKDKDGTAACAADAKTVAMYEECLPSASCEAFMDCMTAYAEKTLPR